jgi:hypothetical protein
MQTKSRSARKAARDEAESLALRALNFIADEPERLGRFLALTGLGPDTVRTAASEPGFLPAVLDYLIENEPVLLAFAAEEEIDPAAVPAARERLLRAAHDR